VTHARATVSSVDAPGARVASSPRPPLDVARLRDALAVSWALIEVVDETASTNADLLADPGAPDHSVLVAEHQSAGRGRLDRDWTSPPRAGLTFSVLFRPTAPVATWGWLPLLTGVALHDAIAPLCPGAALKWPNDLLIGDGKVAGILAQTGGAQSDAQAVVIGVGLNVSTTAAELPVPTATSLALAGADVDRTEVLVSVLTALDARYRQWSDARGDAGACGLATAYRAACATLGREVAVTGTDGVVARGVAEDIDSSGRLKVGHQVIGAGDVEHLRGT
jgi:BirA family transcriptional regulator, biotin operon repressor / biotin---[acetyl-CoA-carboxylase] ligase